MEATKAGERELMQTKLQSLESSVSAALSAIDVLQARSEEEIKRIQDESTKTIETIKRNSREDLVRQSTAERIRLALEQAGQDLQLALIRELLLRVDDTRHPDALAKVRTAQARVEALKVQAQQAGVQVHDGTAGD